ncbi:TPA: 50S ribosomal protein L32 [Patescibacteria group bacterium]|nr:MAG: 50S ribosomal protein L32 [Candidatus Gottesmanbacteria bacterium RIFCSPHIGHO2_01_FULL_43_15]HCM37273.1 50S ribosomal protein L32 [Patescibacteria group bacterium]
MAPLPKRRHSSRRQAKRTRALKLDQVTLVKCPQCSEMTTPHQVCRNCGYYAGKPIIIKKEKSKK